MIVNVQASRCSTRYEFYETTSDNIIPVCKKKNQPTTNSAQAPNNPHKSSCSQTQLIALGHISPPRHFYIRLLYFLSGSNPANYIRFISRDPEDFGDPKKASKMYNA